MVRDLTSEIYVPKTIDRFNEEFLALFFTKKLTSEECFG